MFNQKSVLLLIPFGRISINWNLLPPLYRNPLLFIIYTDKKQGLNSWLLQVVTGYQTKIKLATYWWQLLFGMVNISGILPHKIPNYTITNAIYFDWKSIMSWLSDVFKQCFYDWLVSFKQQGGSFFLKQKKIYMYITTNTSGTIHLWRPYGRGLSTWGGGGGAS